MEAIRPWWDGAQWRLDPAPPGVQPAPLAVDRWPLVVVPPAARVAAVLATLQGLAMLIAESVLLVRWVGVDVRLAVLVGILVLLACTLVVNGPRVTTLANRPRALVTLSEMVLALLHILALSHLGSALGLISPAVSVTVLVLLASRPMNTAVRAAATPVPYSDLPRRPRVVGRRGLGGSAA